VLRRPVEPKLAALVAVVNDIEGAALTDGGLHRVQHQLRPQVIGHRPANDLRLTLRVWLAAPSIQHDGEIPQSRRRRHVGDVRHPKLVGAGRREIPVHQVRGGRGIVVASGGDGAAMAVAGAHQPGLAHQPRDPFAAIPLATVAQIGVHPRCAVGLA